HNSLPNGLLVLKGGNVQEEVKPFRRIAQTEAVKQWFEELWFDEKYIIYIPIG
ncbi:MAG: 16S rRNA (guanine(527)-N(7))-methyltransferase RsmG, partial [Prevotella micans]|nr:16S rRNA (guanine(527)-N(7))-methyltransferase RsmG [Prevotella micans]